MDRVRVAGNETPVRVYGHCACRKWGFGSLCHSRRRSNYVTGTGVIVAYMTDPFPWNIVTLSSHLVSNDRSQYSVVQHYNSRQIDFEEHRVYICIVLDAGLSQRWNLTRHFTHGLLFCPEDRNTAFAESPVNVYQTTWRHIPEDHVPVCIFVSVWTQRVQ
jgi:hypothetical protein